MNRICRKSLEAALLRSVLFLCVVAYSEWLFAAAPQGLYFVEDFNSGLPNPNLVGYEHFTLENGAIRRNGIYSDGNDRRYMRTVATNYNEVNFRYELTFTTSVLSSDSLNFMGIGTGDRRPGGQFGHNEPWESLYLRVHTPNTAGGYVGIANHPSNELAIIGNITSAGTHRGRIEKVGNSITFSVDANYNGTFIADMAHTFPDLAAVAPFLTNTNSRLFFGTVFPNDKFDNLSIVPEPDSLLILALGAATIVGRRRERTSRIRKA
ncbi:MAG TPA: PEP-CTERM sorting domain-containing protein [Lacipirellulaceae bacterium]